MPIKRVDGRSALDLRPVTIERGFMKFAEGSCIISMGDTRIICTATVEERVPGWMKGRGEGWVTAEYAFIPRSGRERNQRETLRPAGRTQEIQRLIGRSLRSIVDLKALGERTITIDCDVLGGDGGTRCASITGGYVALVEALSKLRGGALKRSPLTDAVTAVSVGVVAGDELLDLCYEEDSRASLDFNVVMTGAGRYIEVQGTAEKSGSFDRARLNRLLDVAQVGIDSLLTKQREATEGLL